MCNTAIAPIVEIANFIEQVEFQGKLEDAVLSLASVIKAQGVDAPLTDPKAIRKLEEAKPAVGVTLQDGELDTLINDYEFMCIKSIALSCNVNSAVQINKHQPEANATVGVSQDLIDTVDKIHNRFI